MTGGHHLEAGGEASQIGEGGTALRIAAMLALNEYMLHPRVPTCDENDEGVGKGEGEGNDNNDGTTPRVRVRVKVRARVRAITTMMAQRRER